MRSNPDIHSPPQHPPQALATSKLLKTAPRPTSPTTCVHPFLHSTRSEEPPLAITTTFSSKNHFTAKIVESTTPLSSSRSSSSIWQLHATKTKATQATANLQISGITMPSDTNHTQATTNLYISMRIIHIANHTTRTNFVSSLRGTSRVNLSVQHLKQAGVKKLSSKMLHWLSNNTTRKSSTEKCTSRNEPTGFSSSKALMQKSSMLQLKKRFKISTLNLYRSQELRLTTQTAHLTRSVWTTF